MTVVEVKLVKKTYPYDFTLLYSVGVKVGLKTKLVF